MRRSCATSPRLGCQMVQPKVGIEMAPAWFDELADFLRIPSVSADPAHADDVVRAARWVANFVHGAGGEAEVIDWEGHPLTIGEIRASHGGDAPTVILYGHFDVQPPAPLELWESDPFEPEIPTATSMPAAPWTTRVSSTRSSPGPASSPAPGALPVNVRVCCDGEEEIGGTPSSTSSPRTSAARMPR